MGQNDAMTMRWDTGDGPQEVLADHLRRAEVRMERELAEATRRRDHYWLALVGFRVVPPMVDGSMLDRENIRVAPVVGCIICEQQWTPETARRCPGEPT